jgi:hypothetical protein
LGCSIRNQKIRNQGSGQRKHCNTKPLPLIGNKKHNDENRTIDECLGNKKSVIRKHGVQDQKAGIRLDFLLKLLNNNDAPTIRIGVINEK